MSSTTAVEARPPTGGAKYRQQFETHVGDFPRVPAPIYRHATPSAPWPWMNFSTDSSDIHTTPPGLPPDRTWPGYPQSLFGNWTRDQVDRSQMLTKCSDRELSTIYKIVLLNDGSFGKRVEIRTVRKDDAVDLQAYWNHLGTPPLSNVRVQALFVDDMTLPVLKMLGTRYNIEPFFFASSVNWIPSRYQEDYQALEDHITVVLPFVRILKNQRPLERSMPVKMSTFMSTRPVSKGVDEPLPYTDEGQLIDPQAPLALPENKILMQDLLSLHMVRNTKTNTIISYHSTMSLQGTSANRLHSLVQRTGDSVYWSKIFNKSRDPTFLFLAMLWYTLYAWDEAFDVLFRYINVLEYRVLQLNDLKLTRELHKLQANLLYYQQLLRDFRRSVEFVRDTPNPAMRDASVTDAEREDSAKLLHAEADNLISEILRLTRQREMMSDRLDNATHLAFATVNIDESNTMKRLAEVTKQDSAAMKQIAYLSMVFLPAAFLANVFSMNVREINPMTGSDVVPPTTLVNYIETTAALTVFTSWVAIALQKDSHFFRSESGVLHRALWPLFYGYDVVSTEFSKWRKPAYRRAPPANRPA